jgi:hypothetical protein
MEQQIKLNEDTICIKDIEIQKLNEILSIKELTIKELKMKIEEKDKEIQNINNMLSKTIMDLNEQYRLNNKLVQNEIKELKTKLNNVTEPV